MAKRFFDCCVNGNAELSQIPFPDDNSRTFFHGVGVGLLSAYNNYLREINSK